MGIFWLQSCSRLIPVIIKEMNRLSEYLSSSLAVLLVIAGCSTMSRTEKQLARVDSFEAPDIPALGQIPPARPEMSGLEYAKDVLIVSYDAEVGKEPLKKAINKYGAEVIYDYRIINAIAVRIPESKKLEDSITYFEKVKGVLQVSKDRVYHLDDPVRPAMYVK